MANHHQGNAAVRRRELSPGAKIRKDDIAKALVTIVEVNEGYQEYRNTKKLRAKLWNTLFADLVVDRTWGQLESENNDG